MSDRENYWGEKVKALNVKIINYVVFHAKNLWYHVDFIVIVLINIFSKNCEWTEVNG